MINQFQHNVFYVIFNFIVIPGKSDSGSSQYPINWLIDLFIQLTGIE